MFLEYYGLREQPFGVTPNPRYLYHSAIHREALASLIYGIEADLGFAALIAEPGMGKTTLLFYLLEKFRETARTALIFQTLCTPVELLRYLANELEIQADGVDPVALNERIKNVLVQEARARRRVLVIIDEAQNLDEPVLETIRLLSDFETQNTKLLHIILAGQLQLAEKLARPGLSQLLQRVSMLNRLSALTAEETKNYIEFRLGVAGYRGGPLFSPEAFNAIAAMSGGVPRKINRICFNALSLACALGKRSVDEQVIKEVGNDLDIGDLLYKVGAISDEPKRSASLNDAKKAEPEPQRTGVSDGRESPVEMSPTTPKVATGTEPEPSASPAQWPSFPGSAPHAFPVSAQAMAPKREPQFSTVSSPGRSQAKGVVRAFMPAGDSLAGVAIPRGSALPKPVERVVGPPTKPALIKKAPSMQAQPKSAARANTPRVALFAVASVLLAVLALAGWTLLVSNPAHTTDQVQTSTTPAQTAGQEIDLPYSSPAPNISGAIERGRSSAMQRSSPDSDRDVVKVSAKKSSTANRAQLASASRPVVDLSNQEGSGEGPHAISAALIKKVEPVYPTDARRSGVQGSVTISAVIGTDGKPKSLRAVSGNPVLARAAMDAVSQWLYKPYFVNGRPVEVETEVVVDFALR